MNGMNSETTTVSQATGIITGMITAITVLTTAIKTIETNMITRGLDMETTDIRGIPPRVPDHTDVPRHHLRLITGLR